MKLSVQRLEFHQVLEVRCQIALRDPQPFPPELGLLLLLDPAGTGSPFAFPLKVKALFSELLPQATRHSAEKVTVALLPCSLSLRSLLRAPQEVQADLRPGLDLMTFSRSESWITRLN